MQNQRSIFKTSQLALSLNGISSTFIFAYLIQQTRGHDLSCHLCHQLILHGIRHTAGYNHCGIRLRHFHLLNKLVGLVTVHAKIGTFHILLLCSIGRQSCKILFCQSLQLVKFYISTENKSKVGSIGETFVNNLQHAFAVCFLNGSYTDHLFARSVIQHLV